MIGRRTSGFSIESVLVGGRQGTVYLAQNPESGHRAAVRLLVADDTGDGFPEFGREVADALQLPRRPEVVARTLDDGREVLLALIDADAPGTGATRFAQTTRLERPARRSTRRRWWALIPLAVLLLGAVGWWRRQQPADVETPPAPAVGPTTVVTAPVATAPVVTAPVATAPVVTAPVVTAQVVTAPPRTPCVITSEWRAARLADLDELQERVTVSDELSRTVQPALDRLSVELRQARTDGDCREVEQRLRALTGRVLR